MSSEDLFLRLRRRRKSTGCSKLRGRSQNDVTTDTAAIFARSVTLPVSSLDNEFGSLQISITDGTLRAIYLHVGQ